jgi:hypothetical protein
MFVVLAPPTSNRRAKLARQIGDREEIAQDRAQNEHLHRGSAASREAVATRVPGAVSHRQDLPEKNSPRRCIELPALGPMASDVAASAGRRIKCAVGHLHFMHTVDVQIGIDDDLRGIDDFSMALRTLHSFFNDVFAMIARHASAIEAMTGAAGKCAGSHPGNSAGVASAVAVAIQVGAGRRSRGVDRGRVECVELQFGAIVTVDMARCVGCGGDNVAAGTGHRPAPVRGCEVDDMRPYAGRGRHGIAAEVLGRR